MSDNRFLAVIVCFQVSLLLQAFPADCCGQNAQKYQYYVHESGESAGPKRFVDLREFLTNQQDGATEETAPAQPAARVPAANSQTNRTDQMPAASPYQQASTAVLHSGISPGLMGRATSRNNYNIHFASTAVYDSEPYPAIVQTVTWRSPNFAHRPLYFQEINLERYGNKSNFQPIHSGARFFSTVAFMPYLAAARNPWTCEFAMGYYRPGDCNPAHRQNHCLNHRRGLLMQVLSTSAWLSVL